MLLRSKAEAARSGEIEPARIAGNLPDHTSKITAAQPLLQRKQGIFGSFRLYMDQPLAQVIRQPMHIGTTGLLDRAGILHPKHMAPVLRFGKRVLLRFLRP